WQDRHTNAADGFIQCSYTLEDLGRLWILRKAIEHVRRRYHVFNAVRGRNSRHFDRFIKIARAVIDCRHDVGVDVDHCRTLVTSVKPKLSSQTLPFNRLSNFFEGIRRNRMVARSEVAVNGMVNWRQ